MMSAIELRQWIEQVLEGNPEAEVAVDDGGLTLVVIEPDNPSLEAQDYRDYCEIGGIPLPEDREEEAAHE